MRIAGLLAAALALLGAAPAARAQDSDAPPGALPHWLPTEEWVYQHWLPFDEGRLYRLLGADRGAIWRHLRDDAAHDLEQLARKRGFRPRELARRLVAPRGADAPHVGGAGVPGPHAGPHEPAHPLPLPPPDGGAEGVAADLRHAQRTL